MRTKFPFTLEIDDQEFKLQYKDLKKSEAIDLSKLFREKTTDISKMTNLEAEIRELEEQKNLSKQLADVSVGNKDKALHLKEAREYIAKISQKRAELESIANAAKIIDFDAMAMKRFELCVSGDDLVKLQEKIKESGIDYVTLMGEIDKAIEAERVKK
ncbi:hypothetical protein [Campylobacter sp. RM16188]|uniref:hypothetical protein n=1 Tax=Campylobacter sp. RM16188 TaxID=1705725 RepID=UPI0015544734|nr:hypothetical protein [Campylobacter sp. RM16188]